MLLARNLNLFKNISCSQNIKQLTLLNSKRGFQATCFLQNIKEDQSTSSEKNIRVYYGKKTQNKFQHNFNIHPYSCFRINFLRIVDTTNQISKGVFTDNKSRRCNRATNSL